MLEKFKWPSSVTEKLVCHSCSWSTHHCILQFVILTHRVEVIAQYLSVDGYVDVYFACDKSKTIESRVIKCVTHDDLEATLSEINLSPEGQCSRSQLETGVAYIPMVTWKGLKQVWPNWVYEITGNIKMHQWPGLTTEPGHLKGHVVEIAAFSTVDVLHRCYVYCVLQCLFCQTTDIILSHCIPFDFFLFIPPQCYRWALTQWSVTLCLVILTVFDVVLLGSRLSYLRSEIQCLEDQVTSDVVVFRILDCSVQPLIYNSGTNAENLSLTVADVLDSCPPQWIGDVSSKLGAKKSVSLENSQVCYCWLYFKS